MRQPMWVHGRIRTKGQRKESHPSKKTTSVSTRHRQTRKPKLPDYQSNCHQLPSISSSNSSIWILTIDLERIRHSIEVKSPLCSPFKKQVETNSTKLKWTWCKDRTWFPLSLKPIWPLHLSCWTRGKDPTSSRSTRAWLVKSRTSCSQDRILSKTWYRRNNRSCMRSRSAEWSNQVRRIQASQSRTWISLSICRIWGRIISPTSGRASAI